MAAAGGVLLLGACGSDTPAAQSPVQAAGTTAPPLAATGGSVAPAAPAGGSRATVPNVPAGTAGAAGRAGAVVTAGVGSSGSAAPAAAGTGGVGPAAGGGGGAPIAAAGSGGAGATPPPTGAGGFPKTDEVSIVAKGPYTVKTYSDGINEPTYDSAMMYYPEGAQPPFASVAFTPGFTATKENYTFLGDMLASHGIVAMLTSPTSTSDQPEPRGDDLAAAVKVLKAENTRAGSPLMGKLAPDRICITGHSMGGGGSLFGAQKLGSEIRCVVPMQPWQPGGSFPKIAVPIMFIAAQSDTIAAVAQNAGPHYASIPDTTEKFMVEFAGKDHYLSTNRTSDDDMHATPSFDPQAAYMIPFYKLFLEDDERYRPYLYGDLQVKEPVSKYEHSKM
jgi:dienelactone hydrolase